MLTREDDVEIHALHKQDWTISAIARHLGKDRKTIRVYLNGERVAGERARSEPDPFDRFARYCAERLKEDPHLWAGALFDEVVALGYEKSYPTFTRNLRARALRPACEPCRPATGRPVGIIDHPPGAETLCGTPHKVSYAAPGNMRRPQRSDDDGPWFSGTCGLIVSA
ncbi:MAG TPA: helix-turn-helix domain-containing protein [Jatrophihabitantaceae bacterium]|jgi:hypothetical protein